MKKNVRLFVLVAGSIISFLFLCVMLVGVWRLSWRAGVNSMANKIAVWTKPVAEKPVEKATVTEKTVAKKPAKKKRRSF